MQHGLLSLIVLKLFFVRLRQEQAHNFSRQSFHRISCLLFAHQITIVVSHVVVTLEWLAYGWK